MDYIPGIDASRFVFHLPLNRIAQHPLEQRDASKLLCAEGQTRQIHHRRFQEIPEHIPPGSIMVMNNTRVIHARIAMHKTSGGGAEVFVIEPAEAISPALALEQRAITRWNCIIGGKNIRAGAVLGCGNDEVSLQAVIIDKQDNKALVEFHLHPADKSFAEVLEILGTVPLPPYMKRDAQLTDEQRYQTVYAQHEGSVAAPTAGLHFTDTVLEQIAQRGIQRCDVTLHVGLGTFQPMQSAEVRNHSMHGERIAVPISTIQAITDFFSRPHTNEHFLCVGTTSLRTVESLYWLGVKLLRGEIPSDGDILAQPFVLEQWDAYRLAHIYEEIPVHVAFAALRDMLARYDAEVLTAYTKLMIVPGYRFKVCTCLLTNFHQPASTLLLLVAAFLGEDFQREVYEVALQTDYRFLSYGDASLLFR